MIIIPHLLTGAAIGGLPAIAALRRWPGSRTKKIWPVFILGVVSHYLLDALPHWDYVPDFETILQPANFLKTVLDFALAILILWLVFKFVFQRRLAAKKQRTILVGAAAALLPDFLVMVQLFLDIKILNALSSFHHYIHCQWAISFWQGLPILLIFTLGSVLFLIYTFNPKKFRSLAEKRILAAEED